MFTLEIFAAIVGAVGMAVSGEPPRRSLAERRAIKLYQDTIFPALKKKIDEAAGCEIPVEVDWEAIATPGEAERYQSEEFWTKIYFHPLAEAFKAITVDDLGKAAVKESLKRVFIRTDEFSPTVNYIAGVSIKDGVLTINWKPFTNAGEVKERTDALVKFLESKL